MAHQVKEKRTGSRSRHRPNGGRGRRRLPGRTRLSSKNQITLPVEAVRKAGFAIGQELHVEADDQGRLIVSKLSEVDPVLAYTGCLTGMFPDGYLEEQREADRERERRLGLPMGDAGDE